MLKWFLGDYGPREFLGFDLSKLKVDEAYLKISSDFAENFTFLHRSSLCHGCPYRRAAFINEGEAVTLTYNSNAYWSFLIGFDSNEEYVHLPDRSAAPCLVEDFSMGEFGVYELHLTDGGCIMDTLKEPVFRYGGLILAMILYFFIWLFWMVLTYLYRSCHLRPKQNADAEEEPKQQQPTDAKKKTRIKSLDTFRGITITLMMLVNYGGGSYWFLEHAPWNGLTPADFVFPWFLWIMGVCIPMGLQSQLKRDIQKWKIFLRIAQRSLKLFAIGIILNSIGGHNQLETYRIPGVLQRFAIAYFITSCSGLLAGPAPGRKPSQGILRPVDDILVLFPQWIFYILLMVGHTAFIFLKPVDGCPSGYIGPGGLALFQNGKPSPDCVGGVTRYVDIWVLGNSHIYQNPTSKHVYETSSLDPEGILGCVPTLLQVFLGIQAGQTLSSFPDGRSRMKRWFLWGLATLTGGLFLSAGTLVEGPIPVNKNLWSLSYVLVTSSFAFFLLSICFFLVDYKKMLSGCPFYQTGMNSIFLYVGHFFCYNVFPWKFRYGSMQTHLALFSSAAFGTILWVLVALYLHKKKKFYTV